MFKCSLITHQRVVIAGAIAAVLILVAQPDPFTALVALALMVPAAYLLIAGSALLWGRTGLVMATATAGLVTAAVLICPLIR